MTKRSFLLNLSACINKRNCESREEENSLNEKVKYIDSSDTNIHVL